MLSEVEFRGREVAAAAAAEVPHVFVQQVSSDPNPDRRASSTLGQGYDPRDNRHDTSRGSQWESASTDALPTITYDLSDLYELGSLRIWNYNYAAALQRDASLRQTLFSKDNRDFDGGGHLAASLVNGQVEVRLQSTDRSYYVRSNVIQSDVEYALQIRFGEPGLQLFLNGELVDSDDYRGGLQGNPNPRIVGASQWRSCAPADRLEFYFAGTLGAFRVLSLP